MSARRLTAPARVFALLLGLCAGCARPTPSPGTASDGSAPGGASPATSAAAATASPGAVRELDGFEAAGVWAPESSDGVLASAAAVPGQSGQALQLDFDFQGHGGHAGVGRRLPLDLPENYEISFYVRSDAPANDLQFKLVDASGDNVWWYVQHNLQPSSDWQRVSFKKRQLQFAWGPTRERELHHSDGLELVLAAGQGGGGRVLFDGLTLRELPLPPAVPPLPITSASAHAAEAPRVLDGDLASVWRAPLVNGQSWLALDLGYERELGGLILRWAPGAFASRYDVEASDDGQSWRLLRRVLEGNGERDALLLPETQARYLRLQLHAAATPEVALAELELKDLAFGASTNAFLSALAREAPRGRYPRAFVGEQAYWTIVGVDAGSDSGLLSEDGALEVRRGGFTVEPFVRQGAALVSWADVNIEHSLRDRDLPIPRVTWRHPDWELEQTAFASGDETDAELGARYVLVNRTQRRLELSLLLAVRPLQANPPTQTLNQVGGFSAIHQLAWDRGTLAVNGRAALFPLVAPGSVTLSSFDAAEFPERLPDRPGVAAPIDDATGLGSALLEYPLVLPPGGKTVLGVAAPLLGKGTRRLTTVAALQHAENAVAASWREKLDRVGFRVPSEAQPLIDTLRSSLAHILISRDGPVLRPGTRSYARSWIRDGAMMSESLLRLGHETAAARYFDFYAPYQFEGGKVPCCVDARGADPVPENDSPGELIFLAAELYRFTRDRARADASWPHVLAAAAYLESLRQHERSALNQGERSHLYGLVSPSISHEGYSDKPAYSYWDDFWALIGYQDAAWLAQALGDRAASEKLAQQRDEFRHDLYMSLRASAARYQIPFFPGAADRGDFDATSTTIALAPGREAPHLPRELLLGTFERYWAEFSSRRSGDRAWDAYTPYELRVAGSFIRLGWRERAQVLFRYFMADRRPAAWNQWAEVVGRDARQPRFIGDMPHAWISSDYIRSVLDLFAYAREEDETLVLAAGLPESWLDGAGVSVRALRTPYGKLGFSLQLQGLPGQKQQLVLTLDGPAPPGGYVLPWPWQGVSGTAPTSIDGKPARWEAGELRIGRMSSRVVIDRPPAN